MDTGRLVALVRSMAQTALDKKEADELIRLAGLLAMLKSDRLMELEKELASRKLREKYQEKLIKKAASQ